jgi:hypothetical protein
MSALAEVTKAVDPALQEHAVDDPPQGEWEPKLSGHRAFVVEAVYEAFLLHYREPRVFDGMDDDLRLLAGDALYALGLERLAQAGDLEAVAELAGLITGCARAQAEGRADDADELWRTSVARLAR